jgi:hypothetical protein
MSSSLVSIASYILLGFVFLALLSIVYRSWRNGISPMPTSSKVCLTVAAEVTQLSSSGRIVEAGSGWGTLAFYLARNCPDWKISGIENSLVPLWISQLYLRILAIRKTGAAQQVSFTRGDIYAYPYENSDLIVCYLFPGAMKRLSEILDQQRLMDIRIISVCFALPNRKPIRVITCRDLYRTKVYVY